MPLTFAECRRENAESGLLFGNLEHFAEQVTYRPAAGGPSRTVVASCTRETLEERQGDLLDREQERLWVHVCRSPQARRGGIDRPGLGDSLLRVQDPPDAPWSFQGQIKDETEYSWGLLFGRNRPRRYGPRTAT